MGAMLMAATGESVACFQLHAIYASPTVQHQQCVLGKQLMDYTTTSHSGASNYIVARTLGNARQRVRQQ